MLSLQNGYLKFCNIKYFLYISFTMNKLWIFGDSISAEWNTNWPWAHDYLIYKGYRPKQFFNIIAEKYNLSIENKAIGGCDNYTIFQTICDNVENINDGDIVIIGWTDIIRFRFAHPEHDDLHPEKWITMLSHLDKSDKRFKYISNSTFQEIIVNRDNKVFSEEVESWKKLIKKALPNNKTIFWSWTKYPNNVKNPLTIMEETNGTINDYHYGEDGNKTLAYWMIELISKNKLHIDKHCVKHFI